MKNLVLLPTLLFLFGCAAAEIVEQHALPDGGTVRYNNGALVRDKSRLIALEKMKDFCKEKNYKILKEEFNPAVFSLKVGGVHYSEKDNYMFIQFECEK